jgi:hypothetical protein
MMLRQIGCRIIDLGKRGPRINLPISISRRLEAVLAIGDDLPALDWVGNPLGPSQLDSEHPVLTWSAPGRRVTVLGQRWEY